MQVHVVHANNRSLYYDEVEAMHRHRYQVFVEERGWRALESPDRLDIDEFDNEHATYLIALDSDGEVAGSGRFIPSWRPNMLRTLFPEYCSGQVPVGPGIWEWTRHATPGRRCSKDYNIKVQVMLNLAVLEFARSRGIESFIGILEVNLLPYTAELGWNSVPLGPPREYGEGVAVAIESAVDPAHLSKLRARARVSDAVLIEAPGFTAERGRVARQWLELASRLPERELAAASLQLSRRPSLPSQQL
jgi:acyl-homoserine lactone synthase